MSKLPVTRSDRSERIGLPFTSPWLLAPMEGVTDPAFREVVFARHPPEVLGGGFTEFVRVVDRPLPARVLARHLGSGCRDTPVGLQLMGADPSAVAETAAAAPGIGARVVDLNFGCPSKGALRGCAGSALLREPSRVHALVAATVRAVAGAAPVTAKIRAGYDDATLVEEIACAVEAGGAAMLTVHARTRAEAYRDPVDRSRIARAVEAVAIPVCGNGGVSCHADLEAMRRETGCSRVMVGRRALADPWVFSGRAVDGGEAARFLYDYASAMSRGGAPARRVAGRVKQLVRVWDAGGLFDPPGVRATWMRIGDPRRFLESLAKRCGLPGLASQPLQHGEHQDGDDRGDRGEGERRADESRGRRGASRVLGRPIGEAEYATRDLSPAS